MDEHKTAELTTERGFAEGEHLVLRPVKEADLPELAALMAENPCEYKPLPWTHQRLKKKYEDKDKPGLWDERAKTLVAVRRAGGVVGFISEERQGDDMFWCKLHIGDGLSDRGALLADMLSAYRAYKERWHQPRRITFDVLRCEEEKIAALESAGFELEITFERHLLYQGRPEALCLYVWLSDWVKQAPGWEGDVPGEAKEA